MILLINIAYITLLACVSADIHHGAVSTNSCKCPQKENCYRMVQDKPEDREIYMVTNGSSEYKQWNWNTVTTVIATQAYTDINVMCYAHSQQKKYGFIENIPTSTNLSLSNSDINSWVSSVKARQDSSLADIVIINLMPMLLDGTGNYQTDDLFELMNELRRIINQHILMDCIVPWKPIYKDGEKQSLTSGLMSSCGKFIVNPESYMHIPGYSCKARATIPITKLVLGIDEYISDGIEEDRLILGIPWHGYDYPCKSFNRNTSMCELEYVANTTTCNIMNRNKILMGNFLLDPRKHSVHKERWNNLYKAPFYTYWDNDTKMYYQQWYEDVESLRIKYTFAKDLVLKGIAVWTGDDLSYAKLEYIQSFDNAVWSWILHDLLDKGEVPPRQQSAYYYANTVTAVALGCLFGGLLLGIIFTCIGFKRIQKKKLPPFQRDADEYHVDDFHDEDLNL